MKTECHFFLEPSAANQTTDNLNFIRMLIENGFKVTIINHACASITWNINEDEDILKVFGEKE